MRWIFFKNIYMGREENFTFFWGSWKYNIFPSTEFIPLWKKKNYLWYVKLHISILYIPVWVYILHKSSVTSRSLIKWKRFSVIVHICNEMYSSYFCSSVWLVCMITPEEIDRFPFKFDQVVFEEVPYWPTPNTSPTNVQTSANNTVTDKLL